jgi:hypothetical protein
MRPGAFDLGSSHFRREVQTLEVGPHGLVADRARSSRGSATRVWYRCAPTHDEIGDG